VSFSFHLVVRLVKAHDGRYAYFKKLTYFSTECIYSPDGKLSRSPYSEGHQLISIAYRGHARVFLKDLEAIRPSAIIDIIHSGETFVLGQSTQRGMKAMRELLFSPIVQT
jgi:cytoplasmic tRNA 2-thiolation protein 1